MWLEAENHAGTIRIERQIHPGTDSDLQNSALGEGHDSLAIRVEQAVPHSQIDEMRDDMVVVKPHRNRRILRFHRTTCSCSVSICLRTVSGNRSTCAAAYGWLEITPTYRSATRRIGIQFELQ